LKGNLFNPVFYLSLAYRLSLKLFKTIIMAARNRNSEKGNDTENRRGKNLQKDTGYTNYPMIPQMILQKV
jgi:predicted chitinase